MIRRAEIKRVDWQFTASVWAKEAYKHDCGNRNGVYSVEADDRGEETFLVIYNNHDYAEYPSLREQELTEIRRRLKSARIPELAYATYTERRERSTYALVLGVGTGWEERVETLVDAAMDACWARRRA
jgi:hypothetical protein